MRLMWKTKSLIAFFFSFFLFFQYFFVFFFLPTVYPHGYIHYVFGVPVLPQRCETPSAEKYYLTISMMVKNRARYMAEWIEFHLMVGVQHIYLYDNDSTDNLKEVLASYIRDNLVTLIPFPKQQVILVDGSKEIMTQKLSLKNSIEAHACETRWMAMLDSDEFLLPAVVGNSETNKNNTLVNILKRFEDFSSVVIPWSYFTSNGWITRPNKLVIEAYTRRWKKPKHTWKHILQPKRIKSVYSSHNFRSISGYQSVNERMKPFGNWPAMLNGGMTRRLYYEESWYTCDLFKLHHYKTKSAEDWETRLTSGHATGADNGLSDEEIRDH